MSLVRLEHVVKQYPGTDRRRALEVAELAFRAGEVVAILGPSGSGKSTLLNLIGGLDRPTSGRVTSCGSELASLSAGALGEYRRLEVGFVFQFYNLVDSLTARENVELAARLSQSDARADDLLEAVGLGGFGDRFPSELSGGQQQRVAIARALAKRPPLLLCDEPTGALDEASGQQVIDLLLQAAVDSGCAVLIVTHNEALARAAHRIVRLRDGMVVADETLPSRSAAPFQDG